MAYPQVLVHVVQTEGSVPRAVGAFMRVDAYGVEGTVGGGHLEFQAIARAREWLKAGPNDPWRQRCPLGPSLGQCCGGVVWLEYVWIATESDWQPWADRLAPARMPVAVFGGGHVGSALVRALAPLPFIVRWVDSREGFLSTERHLQQAAALLGFSPPLPLNALPDWIVREEMEPVEDAVSGLPYGSLVVVMSFSHAEDLQVIRACLARNATALTGTGENRDRPAVAALGPLEVSGASEPPVAALPLPFIGLIGSKTKWARFRHRLTDYGFDDHALAQVTCPIGLPEISGKEPEVIAASVAAQLLQMRGKSG
ncbi:MAG: xanthine dehydrogenase accessory protein XdhC [Burkholderiaceae bacterium]